MAVVAKDIKDNAKSNVSTNGLPNTITLTLQESDHILQLLSELPIKYAPVFTSIQEFLSSKFKEASNG